MASQRYENHAYFPVATAIGYLFVLAAVVGFALRYFGMGESWAMAVGLAGLIGGVATLLYISRAYTTRLQDRIIRLEMRLRAATLLTAEQQRALKALDIKRVAALRFASDEELPALVDRTTKEALAPKDIKQAIRNWVADHERT